MDRDQWEISDQVSAAVAENEKDANDEVQVVWNRFEEGPISVWNRIETILKPRLFVLTIKKPAQKI